MESFIISNYHNISNYSRTFAQNCNNISNIKILAFQHCLEGPWFGRGFDKKMCARELEGT